jgi:hypothetical protein
MQYMRNIYNKIVMYITFQGKERGVIIFVVMLRNAL